VQATGNPSVEALTGDLAVVAEARRVARELARRWPRIDVLINNAGMVPTARRTTSDGVEASLALNHLAHWVLIRELKDALVAGAARVIMLLGQGAPIDFDDLQYEKPPYKGFTAYGRAKAASLAAMVEWQSRFAGTGVTFNAAFPGVVDTPSMKNVGGVFSTALARLLMRTPERGARSSIWVATAPQLAGKSLGLYSGEKPLGRLLVPKGWDDPALVARVVAATEQLLARVEGGGVAQARLTPALSARPASRAPAP
jgi:NAD(P)-dependent dehydrogenase (short-subunit alcohol dehydrogenase family)